MCGAGEQCRLAPLVRAGVLMHLGTWLQYEAAILNQVPNGILDEAVVSAIVTRFGVYPRLPDNQRQAYADLLNAAKATPEYQNGEIVERARIVLQLANTANDADITINGVQISMASKVIWFAEPIGWTMFDSHAADALNVRSFLAFYERLSKLNFVPLCNAMRPMVLDSQLPTLMPERIIDKMLWIMGSRTPCQHLINNTDDLNQIAGQQLAAQFNDLTDQICPIICASKLGQFLLTKRCFNIPEVP